MDEAGVTFHTRRWGRVFLSSALPYVSLEGSYLPYLPQVAQGSVPFGMVSQEHGPSCAYSQGNHRRGGVLWGAV